MPNHDIRQRDTLPGPLPGIFITFDPDLQQPVGWRVHASNSIEQARLLRWAQLEERVFRALLRKLGRDKVAR